MVAVYVLPEKTLVAPPTWSAPDDAGYIWFNAPLEIDGIVDPLLILHGGCYIRQPERHVTLELRLRRVPGRRIRPLERIDWRSLNGGHSNRRHRDAPPGLAGKRTSDTHIHAFPLNWNSALQRMKAEDLPYAQDISEELQTFDELLAYAGKRFRISNINLVSTPPWEYDLGLDETP